MAYITVIRKRVLVSATYTRPANTTAYAAEDAIADATSGAVVLTFASCARAFGLGGLIRAATLMTDQATNTALYRLHLYHTAPSALQDNAACIAPLYADAGKYVGPIDIGPANLEQTGTGVAAYATNADIRLPFKCDNNDDDLYGILETLTAFTPDSGQKFNIELHIEQD